MSNASSPAPAAPEQQQPPLPSQLTGQMDLKEMFPLLGRISGADGTQDYIAKLGELDVTTENMQISKPGEVINGSNLRHLCAAYRRLMNFGKGKLYMSEKDLHAEARQYVEKLKTVEAELAGSQGPEQVVEEFTIKATEEFRRAYAFCMSAAKAIENHIREMRARKMEAQVSIQSNQEKAEGDTRSAQSPDTQPSQGVIPITEDGTALASTPADGILFEEVPDGVLEDDAGHSTDDFKINTGG